MRTAALAIVLLLFAGCASSPDPSPSTSPSPTQTPRPPPIEVFSEQGNNDQCTDALSEPVSFTFDVAPGYSRIEVGWHANGIGQVGFEIRDANGTVVTGREDYNPGTPPPCPHQHEPGTSFSVAPGTFEVDVRNVGIVGWQLYVIARAPDDNSTHDGH